MSESKSKRVSTRTAKGDLTPFARKALSRCQSSLLIHFEGVPQSRRSEAVEAVEAVCRRGIPVQESEMERKQHQFLALAAFFGPLFWP